MLHCACMRWFFSCCMAVVLTGMYFADQPRHWETVRGVLLAAYERVFYEKQVSISGLRVLSENDVRKLLPLDRSIAWWLANEAVIESNLQQNPLIREVKVSPRGWGSFDLLVTERQAGFFALVGTEGWLIGKDGGTMLPLSKAEVEQLSGMSQAGEVPGLRRLPVVTGLLTENVSPDVMQARFEHMRHCLDVLEEGVGRPLLRVHLRAGPELEVQFRDLEAAVVFEVPLAKADEWDPSMLRDRAARLRELLKQLGDLAAQVQRIDMAFDRVAVVTWKK